MEKKLTFLERNEVIHGRYAHLMDSKLSNMDQDRQAVLMENATKHFLQNTKGLNGATYEEIKKLAETNTNSDVTAFVKIQLPMISKVFPNMITRNLVSVQPMSQPSQKIFYQDVVRDDASSLSSAIHTQRNYANNVEYDPNSPQAIKEIKYTITSSDMSTTEKKLKYSHTIEVAQDVMAYHGIDIASTLTSAMAAEIVREWDRTLLQEMLDQATGGSKTFDMTVPSGISYADKKIWAEGLYEAMIDVDTQIFIKRYRKTNWAVVSANIAGFIEKMQGFRSTAVGDAQKIVAQGGRYEMGTLDNRWTIYVDPFMTNQVLMGYNNPSDWTDTSVIFAPYIMSYLTGVFENPDNQTMTRSILSRAGYRVVVPELLGVVSVSGS